VNYTELTQRITDTAENDDVTFLANIDWFIKDAEKRIYAEVNLPLERKNATSVLVPSSPYIGVPTDYLFAYGFSITNIDDVKSFMLRKEVEYINEMYPLTTSTGFPKVYAQFDVDNFILGPTPDGPYVVELHYFAYPETIVTASTTWLGDNYPQLLLHGALLNAYVFMKGSQDVMAYYKAGYDNDLATLKQYAGQRIIVDDYRESRIA
jgi:hypothetical protein